MLLLELNTLLSLEWIFKDALRENNTNVGMVLPVSAPLAARYEYGICL